MDRYQIAGDMAQWLQELVALPEDLSLTPSIYMVAHTSVNSSLRGSDTFFWSQKARDTYMVYKYTCRQNTKQFLV